MAAKESDLGIPVLKPNSISEMRAKAALSQLHLSDAAQNILLEQGSFDKDTTGLASISTSNELLIQVRNSLGAIIDSVADNPSILSRITTFWGNLSLVEKIVGGLLVSGPTGAIAVAANVGFLLAVSVSAGAYITTGFVFEDHLVHTKSMTAKLKEGIFGIADVLTLTISALEIIRKKLSTEVAKFKEENELLITNVSTLSDEVDILRQQTGIYMQTEKHLRTTQAELEDTAERLKEDLEKNQQLYDETLRQIAVTKAEHERCQQKLAEEIRNLAAKKGELEVELDKTKAVATTLQGTVKTLSNAVIGNAEQRQEFQGRLDKFLSDKEKNFSEVTDRICKAESELSSVKSQLETSLRQHEELMQTQAVLVEQLKSINGLMLEPVDARDQKLSDAKAMSVMGVLAAPKRKQSSEEKAIDAVEVLAM